MEVKLRYDNLSLPANVDEILSSDFWIFRSLNAMVMSFVTEPVKFTSTVSILVSKGSCRAEINLEDYEIKAPCLVNIYAGEILQTKEISPDFESSFVVLSNRLAQGIFTCIHGVEAFQFVRRRSVIPLNDDAIELFRNYYKEMERISADDVNQYRFQALLYSTVAFFFKNMALICPRDSNESEVRSHIAEDFMSLARQNFRTHRFLEFYANQLGVTVRHMSRLVKMHTGTTAAQWLDRMVTLEAKVLLKSSNLTVQQISNELNFPSASFFCKYFKNKVGVTPRAYRFPPA